MDVNRENTSAKAKIGIIGLVAAGLVLRLHNLSVYKIYPDSYQNLVVASNLLHAHRLTAPLGSGGMVYPQQLAWTRPLYPALIALLATLGISLTSGAQIVAVGAGLLAIAAVYLLAATTLESAVAGLMAAGLLAISYNATVWSGFILTEPFAILTVALAFWQLWRRRAEPDAWFDRGDVVTGVLFGLAALARYENLILLVPAVLWAAPTLAAKRAVTIVAAATVLVLAALLALHPFDGNAGALWHQLHSYVPIATGGLSALLVLAAGYFGGIWEVGEWRTWFGRGVSAILVLAALALALDHRLYLGLWEFCAHDPLLAVLALTGFIIMLLKEETQAAATCLLTAAILLAAFYYHTNPTMDRYAAHLLPFFVVPAAYAAVQAAKLPRYFGGPAVALMSIIAVIQISITWTGLHNTNQGVWFQVGYEEVSAQRIAAQVTAHDLILSATPEPYRLATSAAVLGIPASGPITIAPPASRPIVIIDDASLRQTNPKFAALIAARLKPYQIAHFDNSVPYRYVTTIELGDKPVTVYRLSLGQLQCITNRANVNGGAACR